MFIKVGRQKNSCLRTRTRFSFIEAVVYSTVIKKPFEIFLYTVLRYKPVSVFMYTHTQPPHAVIFLLSPHITWTFLCANSRKSEKYLKHDLWKCLAPALIYTSSAYIAEHPWSFVGIDEPWVLDCWLSGPQVLLLWLITFTASQAHDHMWKLSNSDETG